METESNISRSDITSSSIEPSSDQPTAPSNANNAKPTNKTDSKLRFGVKTILGRSSQIERLRQKVEKIRGHHCNVLISGESGVGKELFANLIHRQESDSGRPFVPVNCAAIPSELIESVLFGHEKGSFTGAADRRIGKFEQADGGDIFLDEISCLEPELQAKLLRVIEEQEIDRVGGDAPIPVHFRVISATNESMEDLVATGRFREDLYYRLRVVEFVIPPLRDRQEDIPELANTFLERFVGRSKTPLCKQFSAEALRLLRTHEWQGNVRELKNFVENMAILSDGPMIQVKDVKRELELSQSAKVYEQANSIAQPMPNVASTALLDRPVQLKEAVEAFERDLIIRALERNRWSKTKTCHSLGISRNMLYRKMESLKIRPS